jgi:hypothetical protein
MLENGSGNFGFPCQYQLQLQISELPQAHSVFAPYSIIQPEARDGLIFM